jgi:hypothetical protein
VRLGPVRSWLVGVNGLIAARKFVEPDGGPRHLLRAGGDQEECPGAVKT